MASDLQIITGALTINDFHKLWLSNNLKLNYKKHLKAHTTLFDIFNT